MPDAKLALLAAVDDLACARRERSAFDDTPIFRALHAYALHWIKEVAENLEANSVECGKPLRVSELLKSAQTLSVENEVKGIFVDGAGKWALARTGFGEILTESESDVQGRISPRTWKPSEIVRLDVVSVLDPYWRG